MKDTKLFTTLFGSFAIVLAGCGEQVQQADVMPADRVFLDGVVYTVNELQPWAEAVAIRDGTVIYVGSNDGAENYIGDGTGVTELDGKMLLPGFHDSHTHILIGVMDSDECSILRLGSQEEVAAQLKECTSLTGIGDEQWIVGGGWGEWLYPDANPQKGLLDVLYPDRPVYLDSSYGHAAWVNSKALELAGIDKDTPNPDAGIIEKDRETGEPSGTLREAATVLVSREIPDLSMPQRINRVRAGVAFANSVGITASIEPGMDYETLQPLVNLADEGGLTMRAKVSLSPISWTAGTFDGGVFDYLAQREQYRRPNIDVDSVKIYMDGVIEFGTSPLLEPYADERYGSGDYFYTQEDVNKFMIRFDAMDIQIHVHAIGDAAVRRALDGFEAVRDANGISDNRHQITHLQLVHEDDRPRFGELDVGAVFQALWAYPDPSAMELDIPLLGEERAWQMYPIKSVHDAGGRIVGASDYFVTDLEPLLAIETAITRQNPWTNDGEVLNEDERMDIGAMIEAYTINGAYQMGLEGEQGSIEVGKRADFVVLDRNLFEIPSSEISDVEVVMTVFDGRTVFE